LGVGMGAAGSPVRVNKGTLRVGGLMGVVIGGGGKAHERCRSGR